jgi:hypothetical protein
VCDEMTAWPRMERRWQTMARFGGGGGMDEYGCRDSNVYGGEVGVVAGEP